MEVMDGREPAMRRLQVIAKRLCIYLLIAYPVVGIYLFWMQSRLIYPAPNHWDSADPSTLGLRFTDLYLSVRSHEQIHAWWIPQPGARKVILVLHGNGYVLDDMVGSDLLFLRQLGANLLLIDYSGYGKSSRIAPDEHSIIEDSRTALRYLQKLRNFRNEEIIVLGRSIGSGPAVELMHENGGLGALILESPFTNLEDVCKEFWLTHLYPLRWMLRSRFDEVSKIGSIRCPLLIVSGTRDTLTSAWMSDRLYSRASEPKFIYFVPLAGHDDLEDLGDGNLIRRMKQFVAYGR